MNQQTQARTVIALCAILLIGGINTVTVGSLDAYSEWYGWTLFAITLALAAFVLRFQQLSTTLAVTLLAVPVVLAAVGVLVGI